MRSFSPNDEKIGKAIVSACRRRPLTKRQIQMNLGLTASEAQRGIDWARANRVLNANPWFTLNDNGSWEYGYRATVSELYLFLVKEMQYVATRIGTSLAVVEHALVTKASIRKNLNRRDRAQLRSQVILLQTARKALTAVGQRAVQALVTTNSGKP